MSNDKQIQTFNTEQFVDRFMEPDLKMQEIIRQDYGRFFIVRVEEMLRLSKLPIPPTRATTHTLIFLTSGIATMKIGFHQVEIYADECLVVPAGQVFCYEKYEVNTGFICNFDDNFLVGKIGNKDLLKDFDFLNIWANPIIKPTKAIAQYLAHSFQRILDEYSINGIKNQNIITSNFIAALCDLGYSYEPLSNTTSKTSILLANKFKELLHKQIKTNHLVSDYAALLNVSPNHLNKVIKDVTLKSPSRWIDEAIVTEAKVLLLQTNNAISEVAAEIGIFDQSYFSRLFKKYERISPLAFRKMIEKS
jgi:AraC family transcriptional regulator, transcriptional activator of pobA